MRITGLLSIAVLICSAAATAQTEPSKSLFTLQTVKTSQPQAGDTALDVLERLTARRLDLYTARRLRFGQYAHPGDALLVLPDDDICYTMRTYVVARDQKDSDSTHPVRSSTCQPAKRYQLKTTEIRGSDSR